MPAVYLLDPCSSYRAEYKISYLSLNVKIRSPNLFAGILSPSAKCTLLADSPSSASTIRRGCIRPIRPSLRASPVNDATLRYYHGIHCLSNSLRAFDRLQHHRSVHRRPLLHDAPAHRLDRDATSS
jgi:hypothetical protein